MLSPLHHNLALTGAAPMPHFLPQGYAPISAQNLTLYPAGVSTATYAIDEVFKALNDQGYLIPFSKIPGFHSFLKWSTGWELKSNTEADHVKKTHQVATQKLSKKHHKKKFEVFKKEKIGSYKDQSVGKEAKIEDVQHEATVAMLRFQYACQQEYQYMIGKFALLSQEDTCESLTGIHGFWEINNFYPGLCTSPVGKFNKVLGDAFFVDYVTCVIDSLVIPYFDSLAISYKNITVCPCGDGNLKSIDLEFPSSYGNFNVYNIPLIVSDDFKYPDPHEDAIQVCYDINFAKYQPTAKKEKKQDIIFFSVLCGGILLTFPVIIFCLSACNRVIDRKRKDEVKQINTKKKKPTENSPIIYKPENV